MPKQDMEYSKQIDKYISDLKDWRGQTISRIRKLILESDSKITEEWKWDVPVWSKNGLICASGSFKDHVKLNFFKGASLPDPHKLFNSGLEAKRTRAIDIYENDKINEEYLKELISSAL